MIGCVSEGWDAFFLRLCLWRIFLPCEEIFMFRKFMWNFFIAYSWYFAFVLEFALVFWHCQWVVCFCFGYVLKRDNVACFICYYCLSCTFVFALALAFAYFAIVNGSVCLFSQEANKHSYNSLYAHMQLLREASTRKFRYSFFKQGVGPPAYFGNYLSFFSLKFRIIPQKYPRKIHQKCTKKCTR